VILAGLEGYTIIGGFWREFDGFGGVHHSCGKGFEKLKNEIFTSM